MTTPSLSRRVRPTIFAAAGTMMALGLPSAAEGRHSSLRAAPRTGHVLHCEPRATAARPDSRCEIGYKPPPSVAMGAASARGASEPVAAPAAPSSRFKAPSPGPLPGGGYLQLGARADPHAVSGVQRRLTRSGYPVGRDGVYGSRTAGAVRRFQAAHGLLADAIVGRQTSSALRHFSRKPSSAAPSPSAAPPPKAGLGSAAQTRTRVVGAIAAKKGRLTFDVHSLNADGIVSATLRSGGSVVPVDAAPLRSAARSGHVGVKLVRRAGKRAAVVSAVRAPRSKGRRRPSAALRRSKLVVVVSVTGSGAGSSQRPGAAAPPPPAARARDIGFGAFTPNDPYNARTDGTDALQSALGRRVDTVLWYQNWGGSDWISSVQAPVVNAVLNSGRAPLITWEPWDPAAGTNQPRFSLSKIAGGDFDAYIASWATALKALGHTIYLRPMHEMNGNWYPWAGSVNGSSPALYVQAWRHMHDIFAQQGAGNVRWVWAPNNADVSGNRLESFYPGASYVDVLGVDGYNWGTSQAGAGWQSFSEVFSSTYDRLQRLGPQPIWITEVGSAPEGGDKGAWIRDMFAKAQGMSRLEKIVWFNENKERDWRAAPSPDVTAAFKPGAASGGTQPSLHLQLRGRARAGRAASVRWIATGAGSVKRWDAYLNRRRVRTLSSRTSPVVTKRIPRAGRNRWRVQGRDGRGRTVVSGSLSFRATR